MTDTPIRFQLGTVVSTIGALQVASEDQIRAILSRHERGDWGEVCPEDAKANEWSLKHGARLLSSYTVNGEKLWAITEADRSSTTVLTPDEY